MDAFHHTAGGIDWYCERRGAGPAVVLIPSGEGDCASFAAVADLLAADSTVLTFDTPGFSRTSTPADAADISLYRLGGQVAALVTSLGIDRATYWGCSSAAVAVVDLLRDHPALVRNAVIHESAGMDDAATAGGGPLGRLLTMDDAGIVAFLTPFFANVFNEDAAKWDALGPDVHARLALNYVTWVRQYVAKVDPARRIDPATLRGKPLTWTIGGLTPAAMFLGNVKLACAAGIDIGLLPCRHFPQVSIPDVLAGHIRAATLPHLA